MGKSIVNLKRKNMIEYSGTPFVSIDADNAMKALSNNIPNLIEKEKLRRAKLKAKREAILIYIMLDLLAIALLCSCKTTITTNYKISTPKGNFYTNDFLLDYEKDSIYIVEFNHNGQIRRNGVFKIDQVVIEEKK